MNRINKVLILTLAISLFGVANSNAQYVKSIPKHPKVKPAHRISKYQVWVPGDWMFDGKSYYYRDGYWGFPPANNVVYKPGRWIKSDKGYSHVPGSWILKR